MNTNYKETAVNLYEHGWNGGWSISVLKSLSQIIYKAERGDCNNKSKNTFQEMNTNKSDLHLLLLRHIQIKWIWV